MEKLSISNYLSFIAGVLDTGDCPLHSNIFTNFGKNSYGSNRVFRAMGETDM
jgi:hypothetical protein